MQNEQLAISISGSNFIANFEMLIFQFALISNKNGQGAKLGIDALLPGE
jgi:hypothetical protein